MPLAVLSFVTPPPNSAARRSPYPPLSLRSAIRCLLPVLLIHAVSLEALAVAQDSGTPPATGRCTQAIVVDNLVEWTDRAERLSASVAGLRSGAQLTGHDALLEAIEILAGDGGTLAEECRLCGAHEISRQVARVAHYLGANARKLKSAQGSRADRLLAEIIETLARAGTLR